MFHPFFLLVHVQLTINYACTFPKHLKKRISSTTKKATIYLFYFLKLIFPLVDLSVKFLLKKKKKELSRNDLSKEKY